MAECTICSIIKDKKEVIYEDSRIAAFLHPSPAAKGHIIVTSVEHFAIMEQVPDFVMNELFVKANKISTACFEGIGAEGTNIIIRNGIAAGQNQNHFTIDVIPRNENDGLNFAWATKKLSEEEMSTVELRLKEHASRIGEFEKEKQKPLEMEKPEELPGDEEDYMIRQLRRMP